MRTNSRARFAAILVSAVVAAVAWIVSPVGPVRAWPLEESPEAEALAATDRFMEAFNLADLAAWARTLNYPHARLTGGVLRVWQTADEYAQDGFDFAGLRAGGWHHSRFEKREVLHVSPRQVHLTVRFSRYDAANRRLASYDAVYVVTEHDGHWGVQARLSTAP